MKVLYEKYSEQQERARKEAREMKARKIELEERLAQWEKERDTFSPKKVHAHDEVAGDLDHVMVMCYQSHHLTGGWVCCCLGDRLATGRPILVSGIIDIEYLWWDGSGVTG